MGDKINVGIVGGGFGNYGLIPAFKLENRCKIVSICTKNAKKAKEISSMHKIDNYYTNYEDMLNKGDIHVLAIATVPSIQEKIIKFAAEKKIHIFCEKPIATSYESALLLSKIVEKNNVKSCIDFPFLEIEEFKQLRKKISCGDLGNIKECSINWKFNAHHIKYNTNSWKQQKQEGGGLLSIYASHTLNYIEYLFGKIKEFLIEKYSETELFVKFRTNANFPFP